MCLSVAAKDLLQQADEAFVWQELDQGYKMCVREVCYRGVQQRWAVVYSQQAYQRECKTLANSIQKAQDSLQKAWWHLGNEVFQCESDAQKALQRFAKSLVYHRLSAQIEPALQHAGKGRPSKGAEPSIVGYKIVGQLSPDEQKIALIQRTKGRFILATNQLDREALPDPEMLLEYKGQSKTESGFKFIKDHTFEVSSIFLKRPGRIAALMMVMTLCLMVYGIAQFDFRAALEQAQDTIPSQTKKETAKPSMKWVYRLFQGVHLVHLRFEEVTQELVINLKPVHKKIIRHFGARAMEIYGIT